MLGHLSSPVAAQAQRVLDVGGSVLAKVSEITGGDEGRFFGANILLTFDDPTAPIEPNIPDVPGGCRPTPYRYAVQGAKRDTAEDVTVEVRARNKQEAIELANSNGILVAEIRRAPPRYHLKDTDTP